MVKPFAPENDQLLPPMKVLFLGVNEEDTTFLTKGTRLDVVRRASSNSTGFYPEQEHFDALVLDAAHSSADRIQELKKSGQTAVFMLTDSPEVPVAVQMIKQGADGFLVRGVTNPSAFLRMAQLARGRE